MIPNGQFLTEKSNIHVQKVFIHKIDVFKFFLIGSKIHSILFVKHAYLVKRRS